MTITLADELEELINEKVKSGEYKSADEVIMASLRLLKAQKKGIEVLRQEIMRGITDDPILQLGNKPIKDEIEDASENHDRYIYNQ
ncbi:MAG: Bacterial antitoxin of ParD toxin-antitoxin type system [Acidobacteriota bacterium]|jgi:putative addiction module CopG family antidote|nr:Bacterial antitoxin of ParD toxin-antitoxin type system [Acidobacteriota bacterium]